MSESKVSLIIPAYNEEQQIPITYETIRSVMNEAGIDFEIIFVNDGSADGTYEAIERLVADGAGEVVGISLSRNFGKESAIFAGLREATGDACVVMDCDLQHPAQVVPQMFELWQQGYEVVEGVKSDRGSESGLHRLFARMFYGIISSFSDIDMRNTSDFKLLDCKVVDSLLEMPERAPFFRGLSQWVGFKSTKLPFEVAEREIGQSKWSTKQLMKYAVHNIAVFSSRPLQIVTALGGLFLILALVQAIESLYQFFTGTAVEGFTTVILLLLIIGGILMLSLGIIGYYIGQIYNEIKARPRYIVSKRCGTKERKQD